MSSKLRLLKAANQYYSEGFLANYYDENTGELVEGSGDGLARFIVVELIEAADSPLAAIVLLENAKGDLDLAIEGLQEINDHNAEIEASTPEEELEIQSDPKFT